MRSFGYILSVAFLLTLLSCEVKMPDYVIPPYKIEAFLYDYHLIQSMGGQYSSDDYKEKLYYSYIFEKHNIEKEAFDSSMQWYSRHPKYLKWIYESLETRLNAEVDKLDKEKNLLEDGITIDAVSLAADSVNLWTGLKSKYLTSTPLNSKLCFSFVVPDDTTFVKNDSLCFSFVACYVPLKEKLQKQSAYASIRLDYEDESVFTNACSVDSSGFYSLSAPRNPDSKLKSMTGFVYYADDDTIASSGLLLGDISVVRIHPSVPKINKP